MNNLQIKKDGLQILIFWPRKQGLKCQKGTGSCSWYTLVLAVSKISRLT